MTSFKRVIGDPFHRSVYGFILAFGLVGLMGACGSPPNIERNETPAKVESQNLDDRIEKMCDTETGNLIYVFRGYGITVVPGGCKKDTYAS